MTEARTILAGEPAPPKRRRWLWPVAVPAVAALAAGAWLAGEYIARGIVETSVRDRVITQLSLPADQLIDVDVPGPVIPQLMIGSFGDMTISSEDVTLEGLTADITVNAQDVPLRGGDWSGGSARIRLDEDQVQMLLAQVDGFPADSVELNEPDVTANFDLQVFALTVPVGVSLTPRAADGDIVLTPSSLQVGGGVVSAESLTQSFGAMAAPVLRDWEVCIADRLPSTLTLTAIAVQGAQIVADLEIDSALLYDDGASELGTCS
ncbi:DUF2993 domain-containing protein [Microbacterium sp.]|uniref:LmeA family phospholipid-binding protein n=1 Tax=Microbacterium sp. TaxID=51671 RepID=UPI0025CDA0B7|nr:DUF2993 domain-containing protein [Microbacterium sp.]